MLKKLLFIINPVAGKKRITRELYSALNVFAENGYETTVFLTRQRGEATDRVLASAQEAFDRIVCAGGDGTLREVIAGMLQLPKEKATSLGYIPCGTTNDFGASLGLPTSIKKAAEIACMDTTRGIDVGMYGEQCFSYIAAFGAFTAASYAAPQSVKNVLGHAAYILSGIRELNSFRSYHVRVETETQCLEENVIMGAVSNSTSVGGILTLDQKQVSLSDGLFEILLIRYPKDLIDLGDIAEKLFSKQYNSKDVYLLKASQVRITMAEGLEWTLDGEKMKGEADSSIRVLPGAIRLALPDGK